MVCTGSRKGASKYLLNPTDVSESVLFHPGDQLHNWTLGALDFRAASIRGRSRRPEHSSTATV
jgi:hypothetical protein